MNIVETLVSFLKTNAAIAALISGRVYPHRPPTSATFPIVTYQRINTRDEQSHDGLSGLVAADFSIKSWSPDLSVAESIAQTVKQQIAGRGKLGDRSNVLIENEISLDDPDSALYQSILTVRIWHNE